MDLSLIPSAILDRVFTPLVDWPQVVLQAPHPPPDTTSGVARTCPRCNDKDASVHWKGTTVCPWCGFDTEELS